MPPSGSFQNITGMLGNGRVQTSSPFSPITGWPSSFHTSTQRPRPAHWISPFQTGSSGLPSTKQPTTTQPQAGDQFALLIPVAIPLLVLALPFLDTLLAVGRRMRSGTGIMTADKQHLHHRLLEIGHSPRRAVLILYAWSALLAGSVVALSFTGPRRVLPFFLVVVACGVFGLLSPRWRRRQA